MKKNLTTTHSEIHLIRYSGKLRCGYLARIAFKSETILYGIYWGGDMEKWIPAKWFYPTGNYNLDGKKSDLDLMIDIDFIKYLNENTKC
jgi:hypothetical protein